MHHLTKLPSALFGLALVTPLLGQTTVLAASESGLRLDLTAGILSVQTEEARTMDDVIDAGTTDGTLDPAAASATDEDDLAKKTQNPVADLISIPFQNNFTFPTGPGNDVQWVLNIQPVIPVKLSEDWNLITRTILPIIHQPGLGQGMSSDNGIGDIQFTGFISPSDPGEFIWGAGPVFRFPTASKNTLGAEKWSAGPSFVGLRSSGPWVVGGLVQNIWSYAGASGRNEVNQFLLQPFLNYNMPDGWYLTSSPIVTADWNRPNKKWTVPVGGGIGKIVRFGKLPVNMQLQTYYNVAKPDAVGDWTIRFQIQLLFPAG